jgi:uncharacterized protein (DUF302 family)
MVGTLLSTSLDNGVPLRDVQEAASHADPRTTMRYDRARGYDGSIWPLGRVGAGDHCGCAAAIVTVHEFSSRRPDSLVPFGRVGHRDAIEQTWGRGAARRWMKRSPREHAFLNENQTTTCSRRRARLRLTSKGSLMPDSTQSSDGVITKPSSTSVAQTIDGLRRLIADRGFTVLNVIDHSGVAERAGVQMPDSKLVMFGKPAVMLAAPLAALDIPLKVLVWQDSNGVVSVSYNSPEFLAGRHHLEGALRAPFDAVESIVEALPGA